MLPMLQRETVDRHEWITQDEILDCYAIGQCTPGVIAVNTATYVGYRCAGFWGSLVATIAVVCPSLIIITIIAAVLQNIMEYEAVVRAFAGIRVAVAAVVTSAVLSLFKKGVDTRGKLAVFAVVFMLTVVLDISPVLVVLAAIALGVLAEVRRAKE